MIKFEDGRNSGKWLLIRSKQNNSRSRFFKKILRNLFILISTLIYLVQKVQTQKHLEHKLDKKKISFKEHLKDRFAKVNRGNAILKKLSGFLPPHSSISLYKSFIQPHLDYADIIYYQPSNLNLCKKKLKIFSTMQF